MGSLEEEQLVQMVHDFIESEPSSPILSSVSNHLPSQISTLQEILRSGTDFEREVMEIVLKHIRSKRDVQRSSGLKKWLKMNGFDASLCRTCWVSSSGCPAGDYEYIEMVKENENGDTERFIVDIDFKSQFELARPSPTYKELTDALPSIFVGSGEKLRNVISVVCSAAKQSFREAGLHLPPWRTTTYVHSKWLSATRKVGGCGRAEGEQPTPRGEVVGLGKWAPPTPMVKPKGQRRELGGGGSALSSQFSNTGINCC
ncbi:Ribosomal protein L17 family protein [Hibiscus syriacus]|uniref:Ribosomal protein L17 family protein n=1 Tax=Hibiscus syriacus TaxID=106335 RepID=A0A6A3AVK9_HIBSY|nr:uncharacterized protein LOC120122594 [Hibiscus syriacus]KAE8706869.1 Ribosomal protein L17 family protein [Hibiscus syriacus]